MKRKKTWLIVIGLTVLAAGGIFWVLWGRDTAPPDYHTLESEPFVQVVSATGRLVPSRTVQIQSQVSARLDVLAAAEGDFVIRGRLLATLDDSDVRQRISENQANVATAQARSRSIAELAAPLTREELQLLTLNRDQLVRTLERQEALYDQGALPLDVLEETRSQVEQQDSRIRSAEISLASRQSGGSEAAEASAAVNQARSSLFSLEEELSKYTFTAPFDGIILEQLVEPGEWVQPGTTLFVLAGRDGFYAEVELDERTIGLIQVGQRASLWPEAYPSREVAAQVVSISPRVNADTGTVLVRLSLAEQADFLIQDLTVQAEIEVRTLESALLLPASYLWQQNPAMVLVAVDEKVLSRQLTVESVSLDQYLVLEGLTSGDRVIDPQSGLAPGDPVSLPARSEGGGDQ